MDNPNCSAKSPTYNDYGRTWHTGIEKWEEGDYGKGGIWS